MALRGAWTEQNGSKIVLYSVRSAFAIPRPLRVFQTRVELNNLSLNGLASEYFNVSVGFKGIGRGHLGIDTAKS